MFIKVLNIPLKALLKKQWRTLYSLRLGTVFFKEHLTVAAYKKDHEVLKHSFSLIRYLPIDSVVMVTMKICKRVLW